MDAAGTLLSLQASAAHFLASLGAAAVLAWEVRPLVSLAAPVGHYQSLVALVGHPRVALSQQLFARTPWLPACLPFLPQANESE